MMADADDFREPAKRTYVDLKEAWEQKGSDFWRLGHSFDSVIDYLATVDRTEASDFAELALTKYLEGGGAWYDDFAWWGIAGMRAAQRPVRLAQFGFPPFCARLLEDARWQRSVRLGSSRPCQVRRL